MKKTGKGIKNKLALAHNNEVLSKIEYLSPGEAEFALHCRAHKIELIPEYKFAPPRRWRADFAHLGAMLLVEIEGGAWSNGRHNRGTGFIADMEKYNTAVMMGYSVLRYTPEMVKSGAAIAQVIEFIKRKNIKNKCEKALHCDRMSVE